MEQLDAIMTEAGFPDHLEYVASVLKEIPPAFARVGDVAAVQDKCLGLVSDEHVFILRPDGLGRVSRIAARRAFRI